MRVRLIEGHRCCTKISDRLSQTIHVLSQIVYFLYYCLTVAHQSPFSAFERERNVIPHVGTRCHQAQRVYDFVLYRSAAHHSVTAGTSKNMQHTTGSAPVPSVVRYQIISFLINCQSILLRFRIGTSSLVNSSECWT
jgi:hypothetical protein